MLPQNNYRLNINQSSLSKNRVYRSTIVAYRLSVNVQNVLIYSKNPQKYLDVVNHHLAVYRDMLLRLGQQEDCPGLRGKIRKLRSTLLQECKLTAMFLIPPGNIGDVGENRYLILLFHLLQLFLHELVKSYNLTQTVTMNVNSYYIDNKTGTSNINNFISGILLHQPLAPDFTRDELSRIEFALQEIQLLLKQIQELLPQGQVL